MTSRKPAKRKLRVEFRLQLLLASLRSEEEFQRFILRGDERETLTRIELKVLRHYGLARLKEIDSKAIWVPTRFLMTHIEDAYRWNGRERTDAFNFLVWPDDMVDDPLLNYDDYKLLFTTRLFENYRCSVQFLSGCWRLYQTNLIQSLEGDEIGINPNVARFFKLRPDSLGRRHGLSLPGKVWD
jgi:hypothetical protein